MSDPINVFVIAGEPSGDRLGAALLTGLNAEANVEITGVGGPLMEAAGLRSLFPMSDLAVMGLMEVLPRIPKILRRVRQTAAAIRAVKPDVLITIDSPDFCLRVAKRVRYDLPNMPVVHYVAPSVWAWRPERAEKMARHVDHVLALLPFEPPYMEKAGLSCDFVGHPVVGTKTPTKPQIQSFRDQNRADTLLAVLPGSRRGEVKRMLPIFADVVHALAAEGRSLRAVIPTVIGSEALVRTMTADWSVPITYVHQSDGDDWDRRKQIAIGASDAALLMSGTVSLEVAAVGCPQVVAFKVNKATTRMLKRMLLIDTGTLVNILTDTRDIPEAMLENATPEVILGFLRPLLDDPGRAKTQKETAARALRLLHPPEAHAAAKSVLRFLSKRPETSR
ncbi:MAG: lipid-A-disaccharide synthase [Pseudomonadota bacterium]